jgi:hypothetical protein
MKLFLPCGILTLLGTLAGCRKNTGDAVPFISGASPLKGPYGTEVTIKGKYFKSSTSVAFNHLKAEIVSVSDTLLKVKVPKGAETGDITIETGGRSIQGPEFEYEYTVTVKTVAGNGTPGFKDGNGVEATLKYPAQMAIDKDDNIYFIDQNSTTIRKLTPDGKVSTYAGNGQAGNADGTGTNASFQSLYDICTDRKTSTLYALNSTSWALRISKITPDGNLGKATAIYNPGSTGIGYYDASDISKAKFGLMTGCVTDSNGNLYIADYTNYCIRKMSFSGTGVSTLAGKPQQPGFADGQGPDAQFQHVTDLITDPAGNLLALDHTNNRIRKITLTGLASTVAGTGVALDTDGPLPADFNSPLLAATDHKGNSFVVTTYNQSVRLITPAGRVYSILQTGDPGFKDGKGPEAKFNSITGIATDSKNHVFVSDYDNHRIRRIDIE